MAKVVYEEEWAQSILESFGRSEEVEKVLQTHKQNVKDIMKKISPMLVSFLKETLPLDHDDNLRKYTTPLNCEQ